MLLDCSELDFNVKELDGFLFSYLGKKRKNEEGGDARDPRLWHETHVLNWSVRRWKMNSEDLYFWMGNLSVSSNSDKFLIFAGVVAKMVRDRRY